MQQPLQDMLEMLHKRNQKLADDILDGNKPKPEQIEAGKRRQLVLSLLAKKRGER